MLKCSHTKYSERRGEIFKLKYRFNYNCIDQIPIPVLASILSILSIFRSIRPPLETTANRLVRLHAALRRPIGDWLEAVHAGKKFCPTWYSADATWLWRMPSKYRESDSRVARELSQRSFSRAAARGLMTTQLFHDWLDSLYDNDHVCFMFIRTPLVPLTLTNQFFITVNTLFM